MENDEIRQLILSQFKLKDRFKDISADEDFFDRGVSSLTIIELQIRVEELLNLMIPTSELMRLTTINAWIDAYIEKNSELSKTEAGP